MHVLRGIRSGLDFLLALIGGGLLVFTTLLIFWAVIQRYVFNDPMQYSFDLATLLFAWLVFLGLYTADQEGSHLGLQVFDALPRSRLKFTLAIVRSVFEILLSLFIAWIGFKLVQRSGLQIPSLRIPAHWLYLSLPIGFSLLALSRAFKMTELIAQGRR